MIFIFSAAEPPEGSEYVCQCTPALPVLTRGGASQEWNWEIHAQNTFTESKKWDLRVSLNIACADFIHHRLSSV